MCEILAPAGSKENLISAINAGADAVYLGLTDFSARKTADNFTLEDLKYAVAYAKTFGVKVYVTVNTLIKDSEIDRLLNDINVAYSCGVDAFILQDVFLGRYIKDLMPDICLHLSTQAGVCNEYGAKLAKSMGFSRVILARETKLSDIKAVCNIIETEVFIQGALCTSFSGHCYFSSFVGGNSGNRGFCKQPCRKEYSIEYDGKTVKDGYSISLSDLSVKEDISILKDLGVKSFKIEGRLRSKEYVYSAVKYYKGLLNGNNDKKLYNALQVAFNRGNYTKGLAFGQTETFISDKVQNNLGLKVGSVSKIIGDELKFDNKLSLVAGDSFKIIRNGYEVGNATTLIVNGKPVVKFKGKIKLGDAVHLTKKANLYELLLKTDLKKQITVSVFLKSGSPLEFSCNGISVKTDDLIESAKSSPVTKNDVILALNKTDIYPFSVEAQFKYFDNNCFVAKSVLNKLRVKLYEKLFYRETLKKPYNIAKYNDFYKYSSTQKTTAVLTDNLKTESDFDDYIYFPKDYNNIDFSLFKDKRIWLYLPCYLDSNDIKIIEKSLNKFYGVYGDGVWAYQFAKEKGLNLFAGVGFNVFNSVDIKFLQSNGVNFISVSKELSLNEIKSLNYPLYVLSGATEIMDLVYCPFGKNCKNCKINGDFTLVDRDNRRFAVKKYKISECRFKVYNNALLKGSREFNEIIDNYLLNDNLIETFGNYKKGIK
ncbi:MAG: U32 family peptidase [Clostridia bacterium]|nr:U32 family peptidase [Clostridia bacterium]